MKIIKYYHFGRILLLAFAFSLQSCGPSLPALEEDPGQTEEPNMPEDLAPEITSGLSSEAVKLLTYIKGISGKQILSGCMANVNWNINEALWIFRHTGKYPAINCFDYIHLPFSPSSWIDYSNTQIVEDWWNKGGIVAAMWHWNLPANDQAGYTTAPGLELDDKHTAFDLRKIDDVNSKEYKQLVADIDKVAGYLKLLCDKHIPVLWRPLHEAGGNYSRPEWGTPHWSNEVGLAWFWWGYYGPEYFKKLWQLMFYRFTTIHKLNNLIWVWTFEPVNTEAWFPGEEYVHITGSDVYNVGDTKSLQQLYQSQVAAFPELPSALSECGSVAEISAQWEQGAKWTYFMTWYDYARTNSITAPGFASTTHEHASAEWWEKVFECDFVLSRDEVPSLK